MKQLVILCLAMALPFYLQKYQHLDLPVDPLGGSTRPVIPLQDLLVAISPDIPLDQPVTQHRALSPDPPAAHQWPNVGTYFWTHEWSGYGSHLQTNQWPNFGTYFCVRRLYRWLKL
jgi:hypothetical protein